MGGTVDTFSIHVQNTAPDEQQNIALTECKMSLDVCCVETLTKPSHQRLPLDSLKNSKYRGGTVDTFSNNTNSIHVQNTASDEQQNRA